MYGKLILGASLVVSASGLQLGVAVNPMLKPFMSPARFIAMSAAEESTATPCCRSARRASAGRAEAVVRAAAGPETGVLSAAAEPQAATIST